VKENLLLSFQASQETCNKTTLKNWQINQKINLEFSMRLNDEFGGHLVSGHVDDISKIISIKNIKESWKFDFEIPKNLQKFIAFSWMFCSLQASAQIFTTTANGLVKFKEQALVASSSQQQLNEAATTIQVDSKLRFQTMEGFGYALTGGSAQLIDQLAPAQQKAILKEIFGKGPKDLGVSYIRISMGASDLDAHVFSYNDLPKGATDSALTNFSLSEDTLHLIPILKLLLAKKDIQIGKIYLDQRVSLSKLQQRMLLIKASIAFLELVIVILIMLRNLMMQ
jgi:hypothetical protein